MTDSLVARVESLLVRAEIRTALIGAAALAAHGVSRSTFDRDLLVTDPRALERSTWRELSADTILDIRRGDIADPLGGVVRLSGADEGVVDVVVMFGAWASRILAEAIAVPTPDGSLRVATPAGLVLLKLYAGGPQDLWDIEQLRAAQGIGLDAEVDARIDDLPADAQNEWRRLRGKRLGR